MPLISNEDLELKLKAADSSHESLIRLTNSVNRTHKASLVNPRLFKDDEWNRDEFSIHQYCSNILFILNEIKSSLDLLHKDDELKKIYDSKNTSGQYEIWKLSAENTIKAIELKRQLQFSPSPDTAKSLEKKIVEYRYYLEWVIARFPNSLNFFLTSTAGLLQRQAFVQLHVYCNKYTILLNERYLSAKKKALWPDAHKNIDKLYTPHFPHLFLRINSPVLFS